MSITQLTQHFSRNVSQDLRWHNWRPNSLDTGAQLLKVCWAGAENLKALWAGAKMRKALWAGANKLQSTLSWCTKHLKVLWAGAKMRKVLWAAANRLKSSLSWRSKIATRSSWVDRCQHSLSCEGFLWISPLKPHGPGAWPMGPWTRGLKSFKVCQT